MVGVQADIYLPGTIQGEWGGLQKSSNMRYSNLTIRAIARYCLSWKTGLNHSRSAR